MSFCILVVLIGLPIPFESLFSLLLLLYFPGILLTSFVKKDLDIIEIVSLPFLFGICFWIVFSYFVSELKILHWVTVFIISFLSACAADRRNIHVNPVKLYEITFLVVCCLFMVSYSYPWGQFYEWIPPGDDMKYHAVHIENIILDNSLPENYGELYPEVSSLTYPLGYHIIVFLSLFFDVSVPSMVVTTLFLVPLACFSFYFLGKVLFNQKIGLYSAFSLSFLSLFFHRLLFSSTYPNLLALSIQVFAIFLLLKAFETKSKSLILLSGLAFAASGETHTYIFLLNMIFLSFLFIFFFIQKDFFRAKSVLYTGAVFSLLCIPYILRLKFHPVSTIELWTFSVWYAEDSIRSLSDLARNLSVLSPLLFFGVCGGLTCSRKQIMILTFWGLAILVIPLLSTFQIEYPGWYAISPNRVFFYIFAPLCILCGKFLADVEGILSRGKFLSFIVFVIFCSVGMHHFNLFNSFLKDPVSEVQMNPDDAFVMGWIAENTPEDTVILNTGPTVDCSSWVPVLCRRKVVFPSFSGHRGDNCIEKVGAHRKREDLKIVEYTPDSDRALQILKKYNIRYIYIPAWEKRPYLRLSPEKLLESPLYKPVVKKGNAFLFKVDYSQPPEKTYFVIEKNESITLEGEQPFVMTFAPNFSSDCYGRLFLQLNYTDNTYGQLDIVEDDQFLGTILKYKTNEEKSMIFPLSGFKEINLLFYPEFDFFLELNILFGTENITKISENIGLKGRWVKSERITASAEDPELRIYLFDVTEGELVFLYEDTGYGNVDINVPDALGRWHAAAIIYRENSGEIREVRIPIHGEYSVFVLGVYVHGDDFTICEGSYEYE